MSEYTQEENDKANADFGAFRKFFKEKFNTEVTRTETRLPSPDGRIKLTLQFSPPDEETRKIVGDILVRAFMEQNPTAFEKEQGILSVEYNPYEHE